jgi:hypothetical protein
MAVPSHIGRSLIGQAGDRISLGIASSSLKCDQPRTGNEIK